MFILASFQDAEGFWSALEHVSTSYHLLEGFIWIGGLLLAARYVFFDLRDRRRNANFRELSISLNTIVAEPQAADQPQRFRLQMRTLRETTVLSAMGESHALSSLLVHAARHMHGKRAILAFPKMEDAVAVRSEARGEVGQIGAESRLHYANRGERCPEERYLFGVACECALGPDHRTGQERLRIILISEREARLLMTQTGLTLAKLRDMLIREDDDVKQEAHDRRVNTIYELLRVFACAVQDIGRERFAVGLVKLAA